MKSNRRKDQQKDKRSRKAQSMSHPTGRSAYARKIIEGRTTYSRMTPENVKSGRKLAA